MDTAQFWKGMGAGLLLGACAGMAAAPKKNRKRSVGKAVRAMGQLIEAVSCAVKP